MPSKVTTPHACAHCGASFFPYRHQVKQGKGQFCSRPCLNARFPTTPIAERFWAKVDRRGPDECWLWLGYTDHKGYGYFRVRSRGPMEKAHRVAWELTNGPITDGLFVLHDCPGKDNPSCVNPRHLWLGTNQQNMDDMVKKGRSTKGRPVNRARNAVGRFVA